MTFYANSKLTTKAMTCIICVQFSCVQNACFRTISKQETILNTFKIYNDRIWIKYIEIASQTMRSIFIKGAKAKQHAICHACY